MERAQAAARPRRLTELYDPGSHEPLTGTAWDEGRVRAAVAAIVAETESAFSPESLWPPHPLDKEEGDPERAVCLYLGAAGMIWALHALERAGAAELRRDWGDVAASLPDQFRRQPDFPEEGFLRGLWLGEAGVLLVAHTLAPGPEIEASLLDVVRANRNHPSVELAWGAPGTMLAAQVMHERTGDPVWADAWRVSAGDLWEAWDGGLWRQTLRGRPTHVLGPAHGFAGNVLALARGELLDPSRRSELERRVVEVVTKYAQRADGLAQWPPALEPPRTAQPIRTQWCHGAPGIVASLGTLAPADDRLTELLVAGGELTWRAGPLAKGAGLCHGTAGNGYAFLRLFERTGDQRWLDRARAFAMHAVEQVERTTAQYGRGRHTLMTGDIGVALYLHGCLAPVAAFPTLDTF
ncbi:MAG: lanthionine synthetase C family protein [Gaiellaceae bacterium]